MSLICVLHPTGHLKGSIALPGSKSESNRALILQALSGLAFEIDNLSTAHDTHLLAQALNSTHKEINVGDAGTAMRFLIAYYAATNRHAIVTGSERMHKRPVAPLVNALSEMGFDVRYVGEEGYPPIEVVPIKSIDRTDNEAYLEGNISSQFITALLLIAPFLPNGLRLNFTTPLASKPYIEMTLQMLLHFGIQHQWERDALEIIKGDFKPANYRVGADWSSASYWYSMAFLANEADLLLEGLQNNWNQGDRVMAQWMERYSIKTVFTPQGAHITNVHTPYPTVMKLNYKDNPDLAQTFAVMFAAKNVIGTFSGIDSLRIKETDRILALQQELRKCGFRFDYSSLYEFYQLRGKYTHPTKPICTYNDHRMALSFAPLALLGELQIEDPEVVAKSYPQFWEHMQSVGFTISQ